MTRYHDPQRQVNHLNLVLIHEVAGQLVLNGEDGRESQVHLHFV